MIIIIDGKFRKPKNRIWNFGHKISSLIYVRTPLLEFVSYCLTLFLPWNKMLQFLNPNYRVSVLEMDFFRRLEMIEKLNILTCTDDYYVAKGWPFWYLCLLLNKRVNFFLIFKGGTLRIEKIGKNFGIFISIFCSVNPSFG